MINNNEFQYTMNLKGILFKKKYKDNKWKQICCKKGCMFYSNKNGLCVRHYKLDNIIYDNQNNKNIQQNNTNITDKLLKYQEDYNKISYLIKNDLIQIKKLNNEINKFTTNNIEKLLYLHNQNYIQKLSIYNNSTKKKIIQDSIHESIQESKEEQIEKPKEEPNNKIINRCESNICSVILFENRPEGIYNSYENKYLCNLCKII